MTKKIVIPPTSSLYPWALASSVISNLPNGTNKNLAEYRLEMAAMEYDDAQRNRRKKEPSE